MHKTYAMEAFAAGQWFYAAEHYQALAQDWFGVASNADEACVTAYWYAVARVKMGITEKDYSYG